MVVLLRRTVVVVVGASPFGSLICLFLGLNGLRNHFVDFVRGDFYIEAELDIRHLLSKSFALQPFLEVKVANLPHVGPINEPTQIRHSFVLTFQSSGALASRQAVSFFEELYPANAGGCHRGA